MFPSELLACSCALEKFCNQLLDHLKHWYLLKKKSLETIGSVDVCTFGGFKHGPSFSPLPLFHSLWCHFLLVFRLQVLFYFTVEKLCPLLFYFRWRTVFSNISWYATYWLQVVVCDNQAFCSFRYHWWEM